jgi:hypothetical protein
LCAAAGVREKRVPENAEGPTRVLTLRCEGSQTREVALDALDLRESALNCQGLILIAGNQEALKGELRQWAEKFEAAAAAIEREDLPYCNLFPLK